MNGRIKLVMVVAAALTFGLSHNVWPRGFGGGVPGVPPGGGGFGGGLPRGQLYNLISTGHVDVNPGGVDNIGVLGALSFVPRGLGPSPFRTPAPVSTVSPGHRPNAGRPTYSTPAPRRMPATALANPAVGGLARTGAALSRPPAAVPRLSPHLPTRPYSSGYGMPSDAGMQALSGGVVPGTINH